MKGHSKAVAAAMVAALALAVGAPSAATAAPSGDASAKAAQSTKTLNSRLNKARRDLRRYGRLISQLRSGLGQTNAGANGLRQQLAGLTNALVTLDGGLKSLTSTVSGVTTAATTALTSLRTLVTATEYGVVQIYNAGAPVPGMFVATPDLPDAVQQGTVSAQFINAGVPFVATARVAIRSAESDGTGADLPAAACRVTLTQAGGAGGSGFTTSNPNAGLSGAPFYQIPNKSPQTSTVPAEAGFPFGPIPSDNLVDLTTGTNSTGTTTVGAGGALTVNLSCVDTTPSTTDPSA